MSTNYEYFKSKDVTIFPCAYRDAKLDPQASSINEASITKLCGMGQTYIISKATTDVIITDGEGEEVESSGIVELTINGYYFKVKLTNHRLKGKYFVIATAHPTTTTSIQTTTSTDGITTELFEVKGEPAKLVQLEGYDGSPIIDTVETIDGTRYHICKAIALMSSADLSSLSGSVPVDYHVLEADGTPITGLVDVLYKAKDYTDTAKTHAESKMKEILGQDGDAADKNTIHGLRKAIVELDDVATSGMAVDVMVEDAEDKLEATTVEGALAELADSVAAIIKRDRLADEVKTSLDLADNAVQSVTTGSVSGTIAVDGTDVAINGLGSAAYTDISEYAADDHNHDLAYADKEATAIAIVDLVGTIGAPANLEGGTPATGIYKAIADAEAKIPTDNGSLLNSAGYLVASDIINKAEKASTLAGYGIDDAYTKTEVDTAIDNAKKSILGEDVAQAYDTLKEIQEIFEGIDSETIDGLIETVDANKTTIAALTGDVNTTGSVAKQIADAVSDVEAKGYAVATTVESTYATKDELGEAVDDLNEALALKAYADDVDELYATVTEQAKAIDAIEEALALRAYADEVDELRTDIDSIIEDTRALENKLIGTDGAVADYLSNITAAMASLEGRIDTLEDSLHFNALCSAKTWDTSDSTKLKATCSGCGATGTIYVDNLDSLQKTYGNSEDLTSAVSVKKTGILRGFVKDTDYTVTCIEGEADGCFMIKLSIAETDDEISISYNIEKATSTPV